MSYPEYDSIARQAYRLWEERGRPDGCDQECWFDAEAELHRQVWALAVPDGGPALTNLDRALAPAERRQARAERTGRDRRPEDAEASAPDHFIVVLGRAHLRIYAVRGGGRGARSQFELAESFDLHAGRQHYTGRDTDQAGRFSARGPGGSIDERLPMQEEHERRLAAELAGHVAQFLAAHADAEWDYAAGPALHHAVLDRLPADVRARLAVALAKELVHQSPAELRIHFGLQ
jgi:hypothetical protein